MVQASNWGTTKAGNDENQAKAYYKYAAGANKFRIVGNIIRQYVYWVENADGNKAPFQNLSFDPDTEQFMSGAPDPVAELGLQNKNFRGQLEFDKDTGKPVPLKSQRQYLFPVINRDNNEYEYATLKGDTLSGINELMQKCNDPKQKRRFADPDYQINSPMDIDIVLVKSGTGLSTKYTVDIMETMDCLYDEAEFENLKKRLKADEKILEEHKDIEEVFPRATYDDLKKNLERFMEGKKKNNEGGDDGQAADPTSASASEAMDELDD